MRLLIVDDSPLVRELIRRFVEDVDEVEIVGELRLAGEVTAAVAEQRPDVVVMDWSLPDRDGVWATRELKTAFPEVEVVALSSATEAQVADEFAQAGATVLIDKGRLDALVDWLRERAQAP